MVKQIKIRDVVYWNIRKIRDRKSELDNEQYSFSDVLEWLLKRFMQTGSFEISDIPARNRRVRPYSRLGKKKEAPATYVQL